MNKKKDFIYVAAGLFNANTNMYNAYLTKNLESLGYSCYLPQRDGFEVGRFIAFLNTAKDALGVEETSDSNLAEEVARYVPYYLDLGYFMSRSIAIVANLDDPIDTGMVVEIAYSSICNIPVIGVRTDLRSPLGNVEDVIGINPFPVEQCDCYIKAYPPTGNYDDVFKKTDFIIGKVDEKLKEWIPKKKNNMTENDNPIFKNLVKGAEILFSDIDDIHTQDNMIKIAQRFAGNKEFLLSIAPELVSITSEEE